jgi:hypothetical protein
MGRGMTATSHAAWCCLRSSCESRTLPLLGSRSGWSGGPGKHDLWISVDIRGGYDAKKNMDHTKPRLGWMSSSLPVQRRIYNICIYIYIFFFHNFSRLTVGIALVQGRNPVSWSMFPVCFMRLKQTYNRSTPAFMWKYPNNAMKLQLEEVQECQKRSNKYREYRYWYCRIYNELPQGNLKSEGIQVLTKELMIKLSSYRPISQRHLSFQDLAGQLAGDGSMAGAASVGFYRIASKIRMVRARTDRQADRHTHTRTY